MRWISQVPKVMENDVVQLPVMILGGLVLLIHASAEIHSFTFF